MTISSQMGTSARGHVTACGTLQPVFVRKVELCRQWVTKVLETVKGFEDVYGTNIDEVENRSRDGFIPFTDGGFDGVGYGTLGAADGTGAAPAVIQPYLDSAHKDLEKEWDEKNPDATVAMIYADVEKDHPKREEFWYFESEYLSEGGTYFYKVRVLFHGDQHSSESGDPEAFFMVGINTDFEYGRDNISWLSCYGQKTQQTTWLWEKTVKIKNLSARRIESLIRQATKALQQA